MSRAIFGMCRLAPESLIQLLRYHISFIRYQFWFLFLQPFSQPVKMSCSVLLGTAVLYIFHLPLSLSNSSCFLCSSSCIFTSLSLLFKFCIITSLLFTISYCSFSFNLSLSQSKYLTIQYNTIQYSTIQYVIVINRCRGLYRVYKHEAQGR